ncbi:MULTISPECIES: glycoside hydrolase family 28 protein [unclassified Lentimonas]|uniref:glycoside hydrolase family 28 protein n=1 Tax=unclassified Lentimonas TaxID=2630993 RepID=UPI001324D0A5|nr:MULTISPECIES: glycosyl hydrolase family 28 protein [unclassified Lentimonas]CAA6692430.1 Polygalacturonase (EC [Lentimonas sp. CC19]CAA6693521.1 Polygalacturonase (EC [Lentimonas sp. CC10]CAA7070819.1 Polygalacturonase (EC [Lentimonas sp. CC11]
MKYLIALYLATCLSVLSVSATEATRPLFDVREFGAVGDGTTLNTVALQSAIDACTEAGGGMVRMPAGQYVTGTIELKSNVTLSLDYGAELWGSQRQQDYPTEHMRPAREGQSQCLLYAADATNIRLEGLGVINGRGTPEFFPKTRGKDNRPRLIRFENCKQLTFSGLTYKNPAFWGIHLVDCQDVHFTGVKIRMRNNHYNNDAMDLDGCEDVLIENCDIEAGDDGICLKSSLNPCRNIVVRDCIVSSNTAAVKFGTSSYGGFIDVAISNCYFYDCPMGAIKLQSVDGGRLENISISRIVMEEVGCPIFIRLGNRGSIFDKNSFTGVKQPGAAKPRRGSVGTLKNIRISDVVATVTIEDREKAATAHYKKLKVDTTPGVTDKEKAKSGPIMITGIPGHYIENVVLENIEISYPGHGTAADAKGVVAEDIERYPEQFFFGVLPAWGAYIRHAKNVQFNNVTLSTRFGDAREAIVTVDVDGFVTD